MIKPMNSTDVSGLWHVFCWKCDPESEVILGYYCDGRRTKSRESIYIHEICLYPLKTNQSPLHEVRVQRNESVTNWPSLPFKKWSHVAGSLALASVLWAGWTPSFLRGSLCC